MRRQLLAASTFVHTRNCNMAGKLADGTSCPTRVMSHLIKYMRHGGRWLGRRMLHMHLPKTKDGGFTYISFRSEGYIVIYADNLRHGQPSSSAYIHGFKTLQSRLVSAYTEDEAIWLTTMNTLESSTERLHYGSKMSNPAICCHTA